MKKAALDTIFEVFKKEFMDVFMTEWIHVEFFEPLLNEAMAKTIMKIEGDGEDLVPDLEVTTDLNFDI